MSAERRVGALDRAFAALLLLLMVVGSFALWIGVPAGILWGLGKVVDTPTHHVVLGLLAVPLGMVLFGFVLAAVNTTYLRVSGVSLPSAEEEHGWVPQLRGPLDRIVGVSAVVAFLALLAWMIFGDTTTGSVPPW
jgi:hypothetical protein